MHPVENSHCPYCACSEASVTFFVPNVNICGQKYCESLNPKKSLRLAGPGVVHTALSLNYLKNACLMF